MTRITGRVRGVFRDWASSIVLRDIERVWQAEGFAPGQGSASYGGQRVALWADYEAAVHWDDRDHIRRVFRVYESVLIEFPPDDGLTRFENILALDGLLIDERRRIVTAVAPLASLSGMTSLRDAEGILEAFERILLLLDGDPGGVVGAAKELIEATAKTVLAAFNEEVGETESLTGLVARSQRLLGLGPADVKDSIDGAPSIRRILGGLLSVAQGVSELRNAEGGGHGQVARTRLTARHARLAVTLLAPGAR
ncbi:abortive infection family protein [Naasia lichenicola]|nr:abortive infection family protein [Naasia lichenicola]